MAKKKPKNDEIDESSDEANAPSDKSKDSVGSVIEKSIADLFEERKGIRHAAFLSPFFTSTTRRPTSGDDALEWLMQQSRSRDAALEKQIEDSKKNIRDLQQQIVTLESTAAESAKIKAKYQELQQQYTELERAQELQHLLSRVHPSAKQKLFESKELREKFASAQLITAYIMSIDIRRSTDLMLKAKAPDDFASFISTLCESLRDQILENFGVFDKFTGDGILAFFPEFFTGSDAGYRVLRAADKCHAIFREHYRANRRCFSAVMLETGLGIGIDYGSVKFVRVGGELTVVGTPVVYACRLGGAPVGCTYLNQPARDEVFDKYSAYSTIQETQMPFKHEGAMLAYDAKLNEKVPTLADPDWLTAVT